ALVMEDSVNDPSKAVDKNTAFTPCECAELHVIEEGLRKVDDCCWVQNGRGGVRVECRQEDVIAVTNYARDENKTLCGDHLGLVNQHLACWYCLTYIESGSYLECISGHRTDPLCNELRKIEDKGKLRTCSHCGSADLTLKQMDVHLEDSDDSHLREVSQIVEKLEQAEIEAVPLQQSAIDDFTVQLKTVANYLLSAYRHSPQIVRDSVVRLIPLLPLIGYDDVDIFKKLHDYQGRLTSVATESCSDKLRYNGDLPFIYSTVVVDQYRLTESEMGKAVVFCDCESACVPESCTCCVGVYEKGAAFGEIFISDLSYPIPSISECGPACSCGFTCDNRLVQKGGGAFELELFDTGSRGLGVRTLVPIQSGFFISEYTGIVREIDPSDVKNDYCFETILGVRRVEIDGSRVGSAARCFNHSCDPNAMIVKVAWDPVEERRLFHLAIFALREIKIGEEITINYGAPFWMEKMDEFACECGSAKCSYNEEKIHGLLRKTGSASA
ncbi:hypothetical protein PFISCL1PPCAC_3985, partial [Pristionchus fissidentatus]